mgnify:CR=1 FL=1
MEPDEGRSRGVRRPMARIRFDPSPHVDVRLPTRTVLRVLGLVLGALLLVSVVDALRGILLDAVIALFLALVLDPLVVALERRGFRRATASALVFLAAVAVVALVCLAIVVPLYGRVLDLAGSAPTSVDDLRRIGLVRELDDRFGLIDALSRRADRLPSLLPGSASAVLGLAGRVISVAVETITVLFLALFMLVELPRMTSALRGLLEPEHAERVRVVHGEITRVVARYVAGNLAISLIAGVTAFLDLWLLGVPLALALATLVAVLDVIPLVGATLGGAIIVLAAFATDSTAGIVTLVFVVVYQQVENHLLQPIVMRRSVEVSSLAVLLSVLVGATLAGIPGALLAIPAAASIQIALREAISARRATVARRVADRVAGAGPR